MKLIKLLFPLFFIAFTCFGQPITIMSHELIISDSLFNIQSSKYDILPYSKDNDINNIITIENDSLRFIIAYGCGCGTVEIKLVTTGAIYQEYDKNYYLIKLYFIDNDYCKGSCYKYLSFDISKLKNINVRYLKFLGFDQLIEYPYKSKIDSIYLYDYSGQRNDSIAMEFFQWKQNNASRKRALSESDVKKIENIYTNTKIKKPGKQVCVEHKVFLFIIDGNKYDIFYSDDWFLNLTTYDGKYLWIRKENDKKWLIDLINKTSSNLNK